MKKVSLKLNIDSVGEIRNCSEHLKNCIALKPEICIALQRNFKTAKSKIDEIQEDINLLKENHVEALKEASEEKKPILEKECLENIKKKVKEEVELELFTFLVSDFPETPSGFGTKEVVVQGDTGKTEKTNFNFYEVFLPLIDLIVFDAYSD